MQVQKTTHFYKFSLDKNRVENCDLFSRPVFIIVSIVHEIDFHLDEKFVLFQFVDTLIRVIKIS